jgi:ABC-type glycerol-3-phosphate transport system permease component
MADVLITRSAPSLREILTSRPWTRRLNSALAFLALTGLALVVVGVPIGWMLITAFKERQQVFAWPPVYWPDPIRWQNFADVMTQIPFLRFGLNSLFIAVMNIVGNLASCTLVAYTFARLRFPGRNLLFMLLLSTLMIPAQITLLPRFVLFQWLGWVATAPPPGTCSSASSCRCASRPWWSSPC